MATNKQIEKDMTVKKMIDWAFSKDNPNQEYNKKTLGSKKALYKYNKIKVGKYGKNDNR